MSDQTYDPNAKQGVDFSSNLKAFEAGDDDPRAYLERCLEAVEAREPVVQAFAHLNAEASRAAADASAERWRAGRPLSRIDGMPVAINSRVVGDVEDCSSLGMTIRQIYISIQGYVPVDSDGNVGAIDFSYGCEGISLPHKV